MFPLVLFPLCCLSKGKNTADIWQIIGKFLHSATTWWDVSESHSVVCDSLWPHGLYSPWNFPGQNTGMGSLSLLQGIFPTHRSKPGLPHCRRILYQLSHMESPRILELVAYPFSSGSTQSRNWTGVFCIAGGFFTSWVTRKAHDAKYSGTKKKFFFCLIAAVCKSFIKQCCFCLPLRCKEEDGLGKAVQPRNDGQGRSCKTNPPNQGQWLMGSNPIFRRNTLTWVIGYKHMVPLSRTRLLQQAVLVTEAGPICLLARVDSQLMYFGCSWLSKHMAIREWLLQLPQLGNQSSSVVYWACSILTASFTSPER